MTTNLTEVENLKPLQLQCVIAIRDGLENGLIHSPHLLPPSLRRYVLDMVLMHGTITHPNCLSTLSSPEFLDGFTSFNTQRGNIDDTRYLERVIESISTISEGIRDLKLNVYGCPTCEKAQGRKETTLSTILKLISKCPNLDSLSLQAVTIVGKLDRCQHESVCNVFKIGTPEFLNDLASVTYLENLKHLQLIGKRETDSEAKLIFLRGDQPFVMFRNLSSLTLSKCFIEDHAWSRFLSHVKNTLISLILNQVWIIDESGEETYRLRDLLPISFPHLETLVIWDGWYWLDDRFAHTLITCSTLKRIELSIQNRSSKPPEQVLSKLVRFVSSRQTKIDLRLSYFNETTFDADSHFVLARAFGVMMTSIDVSTSDRHPLFGTAVGHALASCPNLDTLSIFVSPRVGHQQIQETETALLQLFENEDRTLKLRHLRLSGVFSHALLSLLLKNCLSLRSLEISDWSLLNDTHLFELASLGLKFSKFDIHWCRNVSAAGFFAVLIQSGEQLRTFVFAADFVSLDVDQWRQVLQKCRFLEIINYCPIELEDVIKAQCHNKMHRIKFGSFVSAYGRYEY